MLELDTTQSVTLVGFISVGYVKNEGFVFPLTIEPLEIKPAHKKSYGKFFTNNSLVAPM